MFSALNIEQVHARRDTVENEVTIWLGVSCEGAIVECNARGVEGGSWIGEAETALDGGGRY